MLLRVLARCSHAPLCRTALRCAARPAAHAGASAQRLLSTTNAPPPPMPAHPAAAPVPGMGATLPQPEFAPGSAPADEEDAADYIDMWVDGPVPAPSAAAEAGGVGGAGGDGADGGVGGEAAPARVLREWGGPTKGGSMPEPTRFGDWERKGRCTDF